MANGGAEPSPGPAGGNGPTITGSAMPQQLLVTGHGFLPGCGVTVRLIDADQIITYFRFTADASGDLVATLPTSIPHGTLHISATDSRSDPCDETGLHWTDTDTVSW